MLRSRQALLAAAFLAAAALAPVSAHARPSVLEPGAPLGWTVGSGIDLLGLRHFPDQGFVFHFGPTTPDVTALASSYLLPVFHGGVVLDGSLVIGGNVELGYIHVNPDGPFAPDGNFGLIGLVPFVEYWFEGDDLAPFIGGHFGPTITFADGLDTRVWLTGGGRGGLHFFVGDSFSIGPTAELSFVYASNTERAGYEIVLGLSLRGWGGGGGGGGESSPPAGSGEPTYEPPPSDPEGGLY